MKRLGLLGGMSWESSIEYERIINRAVRDQLGGVASADLVIRSFNFAEIELLQSRGAWGEAGTFLAAAAIDLERAGAEAIVLCTNTMHEVADIVDRAVGVPLLHIADSTATAVLAHGISTVALLGTRFTMERDAIVGRLRDTHGLTVTVPGEPDRTTIHDVIYRELVRGVISDESREKFRSIIAHLVADGAEGVIAGCTEIELLIGPEDVTVPYFPTARLHAEAAARFALET